MATTTDPECGKSYTGLRSEHCKVCHETFTGTTAGDRHRILLDKKTALRRCLEPEEMVFVGLELKASGKWGLEGSWEGPEES